MTAPLAAEVHSIQEWESCPNTLWVGREGLLGYVSLSERHQESELHEDGMHVLDYTSTGEQDVLVDGQWRLVPTQHVLWTGPHARHAHILKQYHALGVDRIILEPPSLTEVETLDQWVRSMANLVFGGAG
jgi:hypothetical protein